MNRFDGILKSAWTILMAGALAFAVVGCEGDTGPQGPAGPAGTTGEKGDKGDPGEGILPVDQAKAESCATCHNGVGSGEHQSFYDRYVAGLENSAFTMTFTSFTAAPGAVAGEFDGTLNVTILKNGLPYQDLATLTAREGQAYFAVVDYDGPNQDYSKGRQTLSTITQPTPGNYVITGTGLTFDPTVSGQVYGYIAETPLFEHEGGTGGEIPAGSHVHLYENVANAAIAFGDAQAGSGANEYVSAANVSGCVKCHGQPYAKHGYRAAEVAGLPDFSACKTCHYSGRNGFLSSLQFMVDDPLGWATGGTPPMDYTDEGSIMNNTHMAHAMEFPYPQSMQNCATCHEGKISRILADTNFTAEVCQSCHPVTGINAKPGELYNQPNRAPALQYLWTRGADLSFHDITSNCQGCHGAGVSSSFTAYHTGYDVNITNAAGDRYADLYTVSVDAIAYDAATGLITVDFSASDPAIVPELYISFYGWNTKHFIAAGHERDANDVDCPHSRRPGCNMEYVPESTGVGTPNPMFTEDPASAPPNYKVVVDPSLWQLTKTASVPEMIADGTITRIEVIVAPELNLSDLAAPGPDLDVVLTAANKTFDLVAGAVDDDYFKGTRATVSTAKCNVCHDALASSFHSESGRGGDGIEVCKNCHNPTFAGSHLEMASRSIESYVHAIHSFQDFDVGDTFGEDGFDPVFTKRYDMHIKHVFPNFTIRNCEACHVTAGDPVDPANPTGPKFPVVYNVPDQTQSMPGLLSQSDVPLTWYEAPAATPPVEKPEGRNVGFVPEYVTGSASRACGGCHRARLIRDDAAGALTSFNAHTEQGGTLVENDVDDENLYDIIFKLMESVQ